MVTVRVQSKTDDGQEVDGSDETDKLQFRLGSLRFLPSFTAKLEGMQVGEVKSFRLEAEEAHGEFSEDLVFSIPSKGAPVKDLEPGAFVALSNGTEAQVLSIEEDRIVLNSNHPLAGQALNYEVEMLEVRESTPEDIHREEAMDKGEIEEYDVESAEENYNDIESGDVIEANEEEGQSQKDSTDSSIRLS
jgi:FKBP-type peptidyl-prolyl cis-trans isomerase 2